MRTGGGDKKWLLRPPVEASSKAIKVIRDHGRIYGIVAFNKSMELFLDCFPIPPYFVSKTSRSILIK